MLAHAARPRRSLCLALAALCSACSASPEAPAASAVAPVSSVAPESAPPSHRASAEAPRPSKARRAEALVCQGRSPCRIKASTEAGVDSSGKQLTVIEASLTETGEAGRGETGEAGGGEGREAQVDQGRGPSCEPVEHWLIGSAQGEPASARLLLASCNDGYGAAGVGEDDIEIKPGSFRHTRSGGSSWRWSTTTELSLSPLAVTSTEQSGSWTLGPNVETSRWSLSTFSGETRWFSPPCGPGGEPDWPQGKEPELRAYVALPLVDLDERFALDGWRSASLGACSARVDSSGEGGEAGFVVKGQPGQAADARLRVVASTGQQLFVEIDDDAWVTGPGPVTRQDHLEIAWSAHASTFGDRCVERAGGKPSVALVRLTDGKVFPGGSTPRAALPSAAIAAAPSAGLPLRLRLDLPPAIEALSVAYADADRPGVVERTIATSELRAGEAASLGRLHAVVAREASCGLEGGKLEPRRRAPPEGEAVIGGL